MHLMPTIGIQANLQEAAALIVKTQSSIIAVLSMDGKLAGVLTTWDITQAMAAGAYEKNVEKIMTPAVISAATCGILDVRHRPGAKPNLSDAGCGRRNRPGNG